MLKVGDKLPAGSLQEFIEVEGNGCSLGPNSFDVAAVMLSYAFYMLIWLEVLASRSLGAIFYIAIGLATAQALWHWTMIRQRERDGCFRAFRLNHWLGFTVFAGIALAYAVK